jgi:hypothetical protein
MDESLRERVGRLIGRTVELEDKSSTAKPSRHLSTARANVASLPVTGPEIVRVEMWCSVTGRSFIAVGETLGSSLVIKRNEGPSHGPTGPAVPMIALGNFQMTSDAQWPGCPHCGARCDDADAFAWVCAKNCGSPIHCVGSRNGLQRCACGIVDKRNFVAAQSVEVRGAIARRPTGRSQQNVSAGPALPPPSAGALPPPSGRLRPRKP